MASEGPSDIQIELARTALNGLILSIIHFQGAMSGADVQRRVEDRFGVNISPGAVYPRLQTLAEDGYLCRRETPNESVYAIEDYGRVEDRFCVLAEAHIDLAETYIDACATDHEEFDADALQRRLYAHVTGCGED